MDYFSIKIKSYQFYNSGSSNNKILIEVLMDGGPENTPACLVN